MPCDESSVNVDSPVYPYKADNKALRGRLCWEMKGSCLERYNTAAAALHVILEDSGDDSSGETIVGPFMIGKSKAKAKPYITISSIHKKARVAVKKAIDKSRIPADLGFRTKALNYYLAGKIVQFAASPDRTPESGTWMSFLHQSNREEIRPAAFQPNVRPSGVPTSSLVYYDLRQKIQITALSIYAKTDTEPRMATANIVSNGTIFGYITVAHLFGSVDQDVSSVDDGADTPNGPSDSDSDEDSDSEEESSIDTNMSLDESMPLTSVQPTESQGYDREMTESYVVAARTNLPDNRLPASNELISLGEMSALKEKERSLDYTIITVNDLALHQQVENLSLRGRSHIAYASAAKIKTSRAIAWTSHGPVQGMIRDSPTIIRLPGSKSFCSIYAFEYEGTVREGDCGSLVLDTASQRVYGMVVAASEGQTVIYVVSAEDLFRYIGNDGWRLVDVDYDSYRNRNHDGHGESLDSCKWSLISLT